MKLTELIICHVNSATLRLWEPPVIDASLLEKISNSFQTMSIGSNYASQLDIFYRSNAAIKTWFQFWLSIDTADYFVMPLPACSQLINAVTMLSRWARLSSPDTGTGTGYGQGPYMTRASSAADSAMDAAPSEVSSDVPSAAASPTHALHTQAPIPMTYRQHHPDPSIPAAVSAIKAHFLAQPELQIDILGILQAMVTRFEGAQRDVAERYQTPWENNMWDLAAKKISLTRLKLERWADIVASMGGEALLGRSRYDTATASEGSTADDSDMADHPSVEKTYPVEALEDQTAQVPQQALNSLPPTMMQPYHQEGWQPTQSWANDLFDGLGLDQNFFFDGPGDYGTVVLNSLGPNNM